MCLNEVCLPSCVGNTIVFDPTHELGITTFLKLASALDGILIWVNFVYSLALSFENVYVLLDIKEVLCLFECGTNEGLHMRLFKCIGSYALPLCQCFLLSQVSIALMGYKPLVDICDAWLYVKFVHHWHGDEIVIANANPHPMRILFLFASPMVLQGMDSRTNRIQEGENDVKRITSRLSIHELQCFDGVFTRMAVWHVWMPRREFSALKELPVGQHHAWMIAWSVEGLMKRGGASEECAPFGELKTLGVSPSGLGDGSQTAQSSSSFPARARRRVPRRTYWAHRRAIRRARRGLPIGPFLVNFGPIM
uniref:Uncharacterized protein n=1 Tax=Solanum tuberosum TaxID=4113 RepID=M1DD32_SOLTU